MGLAAQHGGVEQEVARKAHNLEVAGSIPAPATTPQKRRERRQVAMGAFRWCTDDTWKDRNTGLVAQYGESRLTLWNRRREMVSRRSPQVAGFDSRTIAKP